MESSRMAMATDGRGGMNRAIIETMMTALCAMQSAINTSLDDSDDRNGRMSFSMPICVRMNDSERTTMIAIDALGDMTVVGRMDD